MDLHDYKDVAENYDLYVDVLVGKSGLNNSDCIRFHMELAEKYGQEGILDIGCGTGLVLIPLVEKGCTVYGLDISQEMLNVTKQKLDKMGVNEKNYRLICASMANFELDRQVSLIVIPRSGFLHLLKSSDQIDTLKNINKHLKLGGILALNTYFPSYEWIAQNGKGKLTVPSLRDSFVNSRGNREEIYTFIEYHYESQIIEGKWIFKELDDTGQAVDVRERPIKMRWTFKSEMELLFELCGFEVLKMHGGYDKADIAYPGNIIWTVRKVREV